LHPASIEARERRESFSGKDLTLQREVELYEELIIRNRRVQHSNLAGRPQAFPYLPRGKDKEHPLRLSRDHPPFLEQAPSNQSSFSLHPPQFQDHANDTIDSSTLLINTSRWLY